MIYIVCVDDNFGLSFNRRRQSQDKVLRKRILSLSADSVLWLSTYTAKQFTDGGNFRVDDDCMRKAGENEFCFAEDLDFTAENCKKIILYKWNRRYPSDRYFDFDFESNGFNKISSTDFEGNSHEKITEEVYIRNEKIS